MKIVYASDLHLEHGDLKTVNLPDGDMFVLAGDICDVRHLQKEAYLGLGSRLYNLLSLAYDKYGVDNVVYVGGNHEHYGSSDFNNTAKVSNTLLRDMGQEYDSMYDEEFLQESNTRVFTKNGLKFLCGTMFTSFNRGDPIEMYTAKSCMNDYRAVKIREESYKDGVVGMHQRLLLPSDVLKVNDEFISVLNTEKPDVVVSHHAPTSKHNDSVYSHGSGSLEHMYYCARAQDFIMSDNNSVKLWVSGHTHEHTDIELCGTRFVSNPRGYYGYESIANDFDFKVVEV